MTAVVGQDLVVVDPVLVRRLLSSAADRVDGEAVRRDAVGDPALTPTARELLAGHVLREELQVLNRQRITAGEVPFGAAEADRYMAAVMREMWYQGDAVERWKADTSWDELDMNGAANVHAWYADRGKGAGRPAVPQRRGAAGLGATHRTAGRRGGRAPFRCRRLPPRNGTR